MNISTNRPKLRTDGASQYSGLAVSTLEKYRLTGIGPAYMKVGKVVVYDPDDLDEWLRRHRRVSTTVAAIVSPRVV